MRIIGVFERNDVEGETFGYWWEDTPDNRAGLTLLKEVYPPRWVGEMWGQFDFINLENPVDTDMLDWWREYDSNQYMPHVNVYSNDTDWVHLAELAKDNQNPLYKGNAIGKWRIS